MKILVTGGCGYKGSVLVPKLLALGHWVRVFDAQWFGVNLPAHERLEVIKGDIREGVPCEGVQAVIHLAGIANDPCGELDAKLTWEVNVLSTMLLAGHCVRANVKQFIFASSASIYGLKDNVPVTEETSLEPVSDYNKTKMVAERVLMSYARQMAIQILRPATVCGVSPRMRLDTMVNMLTAQALKTKQITAHCGEHGGGLMRPNVHIEDVTDAYLYVLARPHIVGRYNVGFENISAMDTARMIAEEIPSEVTVTNVKDKRSYAVSSEKFLQLGFKPRFKVKDAIRDIAQGFEEGRIAEEERCYNLRWMQKHGWVQS